MPMFYARSDYEKQLVAGKGADGPLLDLAVAKQVRSTLREVRRWNFFRRWFPLQIRFGPVVKIKKVVRPPLTDAEVKVAKEPQKLEGKFERPVGRDATH